MFIINYNVVINKQWNELTKEDPVFLYFEKDMLKSEIASVYGVTKKQVEYKLKKHNINKQKKMIKDAAVESLYNTVIAQPEALESINNSD